MSGPALVLRQAQDEGYRNDGSVENLILSLSKERLSRLGAKALAAVALAALLASCQQPLPPPAPVLPVAPVKAGPEITIVSTPVPLNASDPAQVAVGRFTYAGGIALTSPDTSRLHGLSDLRVGPDGTLLAITDDGDRFDARLTLDAAGRLVGLSDGRLQPLLGPTGQPLQGKAQGDAEGLAVLANGDRLVSFERDHRIWRYAVGADGRWSLPAVAPKPATLFPENEGMEALTAYPAAGPDAYLVGGEEGEVWLCRLTSACQTLPPQSPPDFTWGLSAFSSFDGAAIATLHRGYDPIRGWRALVRFVVDPRAPAAKQALADTLRLDGPLVRDNFEGLALSRSPSGLTRLYLLSDDNEAANQRTLLLAFDWTPPPPAPPAMPQRTKTVRRR